jgi:hypothetical protein
MLICGLRGERREQRFETMRAVITLSIDKEALSAIYAASDSVFEILPNASRIDARQHFANQADFIENQHSCVLCEVLIFKSAWIAS